MQGYVYRFLDEQENILYVGSCGSMQKRMEQHAKRGHLSEKYYNKVCYIEYAAFQTRAEAYMFEQYEIATILPPYNTVGKERVPMKMQHFRLTSLPTWIRVKASQSMLPFGIPNKKEEVS